MLVVDRIDLLQLDEVFDVDRVRRLRRQLFQLLRLDHDVLVVVDLVALGDLLVRNFPAGLLRDALVPDARACLLVDLMERDVLRLHRGEKLHGDADEPEVDRAAPDGTCHDDHLLAVLLPAREVRKHSLQRGESRPGQPMYFSTVFGSRTLAESGSRPAARRARR